MQLIGGKIKNLFFNFTWTKKQLVWAVSFLVLLSLITPLQPAHALFGDIASRIGLAVAALTIGIVLQLILVVSNLVLGFAGLILNWVLSPYFMSLPYTYGGIVDVGWPIVRDFINMFFIIALVIIGLATALRIKEYQAQKTLPLLIIIAILINFTPVICGLILDASNILMNFFLEELTGFRLLGNLFSAQGNMIWGALRHIYNPLESLALIGKTLVMILFDWIAALIFFMYALLFIIRYVMIWTLVIVSPIAFFSRIFPATRRGEYFFKGILGWNTWWKQFIEWSIIGIVAAFFLYLAEQLMVMAPGWIPGVQPEGTWGVITAPLVDFVNNLLPWGVVLVFLLLGFFTATSTSAMGASGITGFVRTKGTALAGAAGGWLKHRGQIIARESVPERVRRMGMRMAMAPTPGVGEAGLRGALKRGAAAPVWAVGRAIGRTAGPRILEARKKEMRRAEKEAMEIREPSVLNSRATDELAPGGSVDRGIGIVIAGLKKGGEFKKVLQKNQPIEKIIKLGIEANNIGEPRERDRISRSFIHTFKEEEREQRLQQMGLKSLEQLDKGEEKEKMQAKEWRAKGYKTITDYIVGEAKRDDIKDFGKNFWSSPAMKQAVQKFWGGPQLGEAAREFGRRFVDDYMKEVNKLKADDFIKRNPRAALYLSGNAAQDLGFNAPEGLTRREIRTRIRGLKEVGLEKKVTEEKEEERETTGLRGGLRKAPLREPPVSEEKKKTERRKKRRKEPPEPSAGI